MFQGELPGEMYSEDWFVGRKTGKLTLMYLSSSKTAQVHSGGTWGKAKKALLIKRVFPN